MAFLFAGLFFVATLVWCGFVLFSEGMAPAPPERSSAWGPFLIGSAFSAAIAASHWLHLGW